MDETAWPAERPILKTYSDRKVGVRSTPYMLTRFHLHTLYLLPIRHVVNHGHDHEGEEGRDQEAEDQGPGQA